MKSAYNVRIEQHANGRSSLHIKRHGAQNALLNWSGETARRVISWARVHDGQQINKQQVREIAVAAAAASRSVGVEPVSIVEKIVMERAGEHLAEQDLLNLCMVEDPTAVEAGLRGALQQLVSTNKIQRIVIDLQHVFYDADTSAHLHVFDPESGRLFDAPENGVIVGHGNVLTSHS